MTKPAQSALTDVQIANILIIQRAALADIVMTMAAAMTTTVTANLVLLRRFFLLIQPR